MSVKLFFETHGRFPTTDEFRLIRTFKQHQPDTLSESTTLFANNEVNPMYQFVRAARQGDLETIQSLMNCVQHIDSPANVRQASQDQQQTTLTVRQAPTALCAAAQGDHLDIIAYLLDHGASVDSRPPHNRTALLFASESGHFNSMNYLISRGATYFTYSDQQIESYYMSYTIRQSITRRELSHILPGDLLPGIVLDYLGLGGHRTRPIERLAPVNLHNKTAFGARPIPEEIVTPIPKPHPCPVDLGQTPIAQLTQEEYEQQLANAVLEQATRQASREQDKQQFVNDRYPHAGGQDDENAKNADVRPEF